MKTKDNVENTRPVWNLAQDRNEVSAMHMVVSRRRLFKSARASSVVTAVEGSSRRHVRNESPHLLTPQKETLPAFDLSSTMSSTASTYPQPFLSQALLSGANNCAQGHHGR
jgi:hypothetical protein